MSVLAAILRGAIEKKATLSRHDLLRHMRTHNRSGRPGKNPLQAIRAARVSRMQSRCAWSRTSGSDRFPHDDYGAIALLVSETDSALKAIATAGSHAGSGAMRGQQG